MRVSKFSNDFLACNNSIRVLRETSVSSPDYRISRSPLIHSSVYVTKSVMLLPEVTSSIVQPSVGRKEKKSPNSSMTHSLNLILKIILSK